VSSPPTRYTYSDGASIAYQTLGLNVRTGLHTGEGEVLTSSTVKDLVAGSGLRSTDRGDHVLRGVEDPWRLYALER
jgi:hypothetical protein